MVVVSVPLRQEWRMWWWWGVGGYVLVVGCVVGVCMWSMCVCVGCVCVCGGLCGLCVELVVMKQDDQFAGMSAAVVVNVVVMMCGICGECGGDDVRQL